jgi:hypothetical protein
MLHGLSAFTVEESKARLSLQQPQAGVVAQYVSPVPLGFRHWDGFTPPPRKEFPNQWHVEASTRDKRKSLAMFTVLVPYRGKQRPEVTATRIDSETALGVRVVCDGREMQTLFSKSPDGGLVSVTRKK